MMRRVLFSILAVSFTLLSCTDEPPTGLGQGGISLEIHTVGIAPRPAAGVSVPESSEPDLAPARASGVTIDSARVIVTSPALGSPRIVAATPGTNVTIDLLPVGTYGVELQGWGGGALVYRGNVTGVQVQSDQQNTVAQLLFAPTSLDFVAIGETVQLLSPAGTTWSSAQTTIVQVSASGLVTAIANGAAQVSGTLSSSAVGVLARVAQVVDSVSVTPASATIATGATQQFTAAAFDSLNAPITGVSVLWISNNQGVATISPTGLATGAAGGTASISAAIRGIPASASLTVNPAVATQLAFIAQPANASALDPFPNAVQVEVRDAAGVRVATATNAVTLAIGTNPGSGSLTGTKTVNAVNGVATFSGLSINSPGTGYTLAASSTGLTGTASSAFDVVARVATRLTFAVQPTTATAGASFQASVIVEILDASGARVTTASDAITLAIGTNPSSGILSGTTTVNAVNGLATFSGLSVDKVGAGYTLAATSGSLTGASSAAFNVVGAVAARLAFSPQPATQAKDGLFSVTVQVRNAIGDLVTAATDPVTLAIGTNPGSGTLTGVKTVNAVNGVATFSNLTINEVGAGYTLAASSGSLSGATSAPFDVVSGAPTHLAFTSVPVAGVAANQTFNVTVQIRNAIGQLTTAATGAVTLAIGTNPSSGTLSGITTVNAVNGVASFTGLSIDNAGAGYTLTAASASLTGGTSSTFNVVSAAATQLTFSTSSLTLLPGVATAFSVTIRNALGSTVTTASDSVTLAIGTNPSGGTLSGDKTVTAINGVANFSGLSIDSVGVGYTLIASSGSLLSAALPVTVVSPAATQLTISAPPSALLPDSTFIVQVVVRNALGSTVTTATNAVTLAIGTNPGGGTLSGIKTVNAVGGVATFSGLSISNPGVGYTLIATSPSLTGVTSTGFSIVSPPTQIVFRLQPTASYATRFFPSTVQVELRDDTGTRVTAGTYSVALGIETNPSAGTLSGTTVVNTFQGVASFGALSINNRGVGYRLNASVPALGLPVAVSDSFDVVGVTTVFMNGAYVDIVQDFGVGEAEALNLYEGLLDLGQVVNQTTDISDAGVAAALASSKVYVVPEQEMGDLTAALGAVGRAAIVSFVNAGGTLVVHYGGHTTFINTLFGLAVADGGGTFPYTLGAAAAGTPFAGGPASVTNLSATGALSDTSLPVGSQVIYRSPSTNDAAVAVIPSGTGRIVFMGWDWYDAPPLGASGSSGLDWLEVLRRASTY